MIYVRRAAWAGLLLSLTAGAQAADPPAHASKYPAEYPVSDQTRSVVRSVREHLGLTAQQMQALGCDYDQSLRIFRLLCAWTEPRRALVDNLRSAAAAARFAYLSDETRVLLLSTRLHDPAAPALSDQAHATLAAELAARRLRLPAAHVEFAETQADLEAVLAPLALAVAEHLTPAQASRWRSARQNIAEALPLAAWHVTDLTAEQRARLRTGATPAEVFTPAQAEVSADAAAAYRACADDVQRAELFFFFGRELPPGAAARAEPLPPEPVRLAAEAAPVRPANVEAPASPERGCPFHPQ